MFGCHRRQRRFFSVLSFWPSLSLQLPLVDKPLNTSLEDFASVWVLLKTAFRLPRSYLVICWDGKDLNWSKQPQGQQLLHLKKSRLSHHWPLALQHDKTGPSLCFHGNEVAFAADCEGRLCLKMPLKHNRSQQVISAQKPKQQGTKFFICLLFFFLSLRHDSG